MTLSQNSKFSERSGKIASEKGPVADENQERLCLSTAKPIIRI